MVLKESRTFQASGKQSSCVVIRKKKKIIPCLSGGKQGYKLTPNLYLPGDESYDMRGWVAGFRSGLFAPRARTEIYSSSLSVRGSQTGKPAQSAPGTSCFQGTVHPPTETGKLTVDFYLSNVCVRRLCHFLEVRGLCDTLSPTLCDRGAIKGDLPRRATWAGRHSRGPMASAVSEQTTTAPSFPV